MKGSAVRVRHAQDAIQRCACGAWVIQGRECQTCRDLAARQMSHVYAAVLACWLLAFLVFLGV